MPDRIGQATTSDIDSIVSLSDQKRLQYQTYQPLFWRKAADSAEKQKPFLENQISQKHILALVHEENGGINGFVIANIGRGSQGNIDDFAIADEKQWDSVGKALLLDVGRLAKEEGISSYEVVCGHLDEPKRSMLRAAGLSVMRYWFTSAITTSGNANANNNDTADDEERLHVRSALPEDIGAIASLLGRDDGQVGELENERMKVHVGLVDGEIQGCLAALVVPTPPVYDPGGDTCLVTELAIAASGKQEKVCRALLNLIGEIAHKEGAVQYVIICDRANQQKQALLEKYGMTIASEWYQGKI